MARISRATQKIFGSSASDIGNFGSAAAGSPVSAANPSLAAVQSLSQYLGGWLSATLGSSKFPALEDMNALDYLFSTQLGYLLQQGVPEYDAGTTYYTKNIVCEAGTYNIYGSVGDNNIGHALSNATYWTFLGSLTALGAPVSNVFTGGTTTGSANVQAITPVSPVATSFTNGQSVVCTAGYTNSGAMTFSAGGESPLSVKKESTSGYIDPAAGDVTVGDTIIMTKNTTTGTWILTAGFPLGTAANKAASDNTKTTLASVAAATTANHIAGFNDTAGTVKDMGTFATLLAAAITGSISGDAYFILPTTAGNFYVMAVSGVSAGNNVTQTITLPISAPNAILAAVPAAFTTTSTTDDCIASPSDYTTTNFKVTTSTPGTNITPKCIVIAY